MNKNMFLFLVMFPSFGLLAAAQNMPTESTSSLHKKNTQPAQRILSEPQQAKPVSGTTDSSWKLTQEKKDKLKEAEAASSNSRSEQPAKVDHKK